MLSPAAASPMPSVLNQLAAQVVAVMPVASATHVVVQLDAGGMLLLAKITRQSRDRLQINAGRQVWAQFKATAVLAPD